VEGLTTMEHAWPVKLLIFQSLIGISVRAALGVYFSVEFSFNPDFMGCQEFHIANVNP
jgi:hypothetical protein